MPGGRSRRRRRRRPRSFSYRLPDHIEKGEFPWIRRPDDAFVRFSLSSGGKILLEGNTAGLLYLARHIAAMAMLPRPQEGLQIHLTPDLYLEPDSVELILENIDLREPEGKKKPKIVPIPTRANLERR